MSEIISIATKTTLNTPVVEAYRAIKAKLQYSKEGKGLKIIAVTSAQDGEGKSTFIANLAVSIAKSGQKVLVIDANIRKPKIHEFFGMANSFGFSSLITDNKDFADLVKNYRDDEKIEILTSGPYIPNITELLSTDKVKEFIIGLKEKYDVILVDTPAVGKAADAAVLASIVDGVVIVAEHGQVDLEKLKEAKEFLINVNANILGVVFNKVPMENKNDSIYKKFFMRSVSKK